MMLHDKSPGRTRRAEIAGMAFHTTIHDAAQLEVEAVFELWSDSLNAVPQHEAPAP
jgi:hypothetical protein